MSKLKLSWGKKLVKHQKCFCGEAICEMKVIALQLQYSNFFSFKFCTFKESMDENDCLWRKIDTCHIEC